MDHIDTQLCLSWKPNFPKSEVTSSSPSADALERCLDPSMTEWERGRERDEFARAALLYASSSSTLSSRFTHAKEEDDTDKVEVPRDQEVSHQHIPTWWVFDSQHCAAEPSHFLSIEALKIHSAVVGKEPSLTFTVSVWEQKVPSHPGILGSWKL